MASFDRFMAMTGWIGEHPVDGGDVAHLLLYPTASGYKNEIRQLGELLGLGSAASAPVEVEPTQCSAELTDDQWVHLRAGQEEIAAIPTNVDWFGTAQQRGYLMATLGSMPWDGDHTGLDDYVADLQQLWMGLLTVNLTQPQL